MAGSVKLGKAQVSYISGARHYRQREQPIQTFFFNNVRFLKVLSSLDSLQSFLAVTLMHFIFLIAKKNNIFIVSVLLLLLLYHLGYCHL